MATVQQTFSTDEVSFTVALQKYWIQFARTGDPNGPGQAEWPRHDSGRYLELQAPASAIAAHLDAELAAPAFCTLLWDKIGYVVKSATSTTARCPVAAP
jgi:hypothetical protein